MKTSKQWNAYVIPVNDQKQHNKVNKLEIKHTLPYIQYSTQQQNKSIHKTWNSNTKTLKTIVLAMSSAMSAVYFLNYDNDSHEGQSSKWTQ